MSTLQSNLLENHTPTGREEAWRFTPLKRLGGLHDGTAVIADRVSLAVKGTLPQGVTFTYGDIAAVTETDDAIINRVRAHTAQGTTLHIAANTELTDVLMEFLSGIDDDAKLLAMRGGFGLQSWAFD